MINTIMLEHQSPPRLHLLAVLDHDDTHVEMDPRDTVGYDMDNDKASFGVTNHVLVVGLERRIWITVVISPHT
jgi:hypothetical protein